MWLLLKELKKTTTYCIVTEHLKVCLIDQQKHEVNRMSQQKYLFLQMRKHVTAEIS